MGVVIINEPQGIYPVYNDSYITFTNDTGISDYAEIVFFPESQFVKPFRLYPDLDGEYIFNMKNIVKSVLNKEKFNDSGFNDSGFFSVNDSGYLSQDIVINVYAGSSVETLSKTFEFFKSVKQVGEKVFENRMEILSDSVNGVDYNLTYWEGFPFHFELKRVDIDGSGKNVKIKNLNSNDETVDMLVEESGKFRVNIDNSDNDNFTQSQFLPLINGLNRLEVFVENDFVVNLNLMKRKDCQGVYLKWYNNQGGYSYFLFERFKEVDVSTDNRGFVSSNAFENVGGFSSSMRTTGKEAFKSFVVRARCNADELKLLEGLVVSPFVQMYSSEIPNIKGNFIDVKIDDSISYSTKRNKNEVVFAIELPELKTITF